MNRENIVVVSGVCSTPCVQTRYRAGVHMAAENEKVMALKAELAEARRRISELEEKESRLRHAEAELLREKSFIDSALDSLPGIFYLFDQEGRFLRWNRNFQEISEYSAEEIAAMHPTAFFTGDDQILIAERITRAVTHGSTDAEAVFTTKSGREIPYYFTGHLLVVDGENYLVGMGIDISERKAMEGALRESERRFRLLFERNMAAVYRTTPEGVILDCNAAFIEMLGYNSLEDLRSHQAQELYHENTEREEFIAELQAKGTLTNYECRLKRKDGSTVWLLENVSYIADQNGEPPVIQGTSIDITKRKIADEELRQSEAKYHSLVDHSNDAIYLLHDEKFEVINSKFKELLGVTQEEVMRPDFSLLNLVAPKSREMILERGRRVARGEPIDQNYEFTALTRDGREVEVEVSVAHIPYRGGTATQGILRDVTNRKRLEAELLQAQKMEAVGRLAGGVAHDFNNIMTCILGNADLALSELAPDNNLREFLDEIITSGNRAAALTRQLLAFSRRQMLQPVVLDLNELVSDLEKMLRRLIGEDVELLTVLQTGVGCVRADPGQLEQVLLNLALNARDAMPRGGRLTIEISGQKLEQKFIHRQVTIPPGSYVVLAVSDSGMGMDEDTQDKIFEPFFTTKDVGEGTGLGLSMVFGSVQQSGGCITVSSEPGQGTTFTIYLPLVNEKPRRAEVEGPAQDTKPGRETVLVVEDDLRVLQLVRIVLRQNGYTVLQAENGAEAIQHLEGREEPVELLITDVVMPRMSGRELAERVLHMHPKMKVIYTSGYTGNTIFQKGGLDADAIFLPKPFTPQALVSKVREVLDQKSA